MKIIKNHQKSCKNEWFWTGKYADASLSRALGGKLYIRTSQNYAESIALDEHVGWILKLISDSEAAA